MRSIVLEDCKSIDISYSDQPEIIIKAIGELNSKFANGEVRVISLIKYNQRNYTETPISYRVSSYANIRNSVVIDKCTFEASHFIGRFSNDDVSIIINPRFGNKLFNYLLNYATNLYIPLGTSSISDGNSQNSYWLISLLWKVMLNKALTEGQIPKEYQPVTKNQKTYRGRLYFSKHIHANMCDSSKFYCTYKKLSMDNTINRTIRSVYSFLKTKGLSSLLNEFEAYDKSLESFGVSSDVDISLIDRIRFTRMTAPYIPVMKLSQTILKNKNASDSNMGKMEKCSYFIDIADLWEMYLIKVLKRHLPKEYIVYSPNVGNGDYLLEDKMREIRPDIIIEKEGRILAIIDAKYKGYHSLGKTAVEGIQREDLYQMTTYLYHYGQAELPIIGIFSCPTYDYKEDLHYFQHNKNHRLGLINMDIEDKSLSDVQKEEIYYANRILDNIIAL